MNLSYFGTFSLFLTFSAVFVNPAVLLTKPDDANVAGLKWWQETIVYQIYPRSFQDSDGDGVGDLKGIESRLDYLVDIGVDAIWLSPIFTSPMVDFGYDISNFTGVDPTFGTLSDFEDLTAAAHAKGIKVILDFIPNHSSNLHEWFQKSIDRIDPYTDYYTWHDGILNEEGVRVPPSNWVSVWSGSMWEWNTKRNQYYLHQFAKEQPDLRLENPLVEAEMLAAMKFWLDRGADGFRMDAITHMFENQTWPDEPRDETADPDIPPVEYKYWAHIHTYDQQPQVLDSLRFYRVLLDIYTAQDEHPRVMMTEGYLNDYPSVMKYYGTPDKPIAHFPFNFDFIKNSEAARNFSAVNIKSVVDGWMDHLPSGEWANWLTGNHDNSRVANRFGKEFVDPANMIILLLPGTAITYYGEEIGMEDTFLTWEETVDNKGCSAGPDRYHIYSRDPERTPMQWDGTRNAGFSSAEKTWLPVNKNYNMLNVQTQNLSSTETHLKVYKALVRLRKTDEWRYGALETRTIGTNVFGFTRILENKGFLVLANFGEADLVVNASEFTGLPSIGIVYTRSILYRDNTVTIGAQVPTGAVRIPSKSSVVLTF